MRNNVVEMMSSRKRPATEKTSPLESGFHERPETTSQYPEPRCRGRVAPPGGVHRDIHALELLDGPEHRDSITRFDGMIATGAAGDLASTGGYHRYGSKVTEMATKCRVITWFIGDGYVDHRELHASECHLVRRKSQAGFNE